jgi:hypothetical protein
VDEQRRLEAKGLARAKARSRRLRVAWIRSRTIRGSLALFAVLWGIVFVQLVSGNDPALSSSSKGEGGKAAATREQQPSREPAREAEATPVEPESEYGESEYGYESEPAPGYEYEPETGVEFEEPEEAPIVTGAS